MYTFRTVLYVRLKFKFNKRHMGTECCTAKDLQIEEASTVVQDDNIMDNIDKGFVM